jgi:hypothetical protein
MSKDEFDERAEKLLHDHMMDYDLESDTWDESELKVAVASALREVAEARDGVPPCAWCEKSGTGVIPCPLHGGCEKAYEIVDNKQAVVERSRAELLQAQLAALKAENERMKANASKIYCTYCGEVRRRDPDWEKEEQKMIDHMEQCDKRPEIALMDIITSLRARLAESEKENAAAYVKGLEEAAGIAREGCTDRGCYNTYKDEVRGDGRSVRRHLRWHSMECPVGIADEIQSRIEAPQAKPNKRKTR